MPVTVKMGMFNLDEDDTLICFRCSEKLRHGERYCHWGIQFEKEFVQCSFHRTPTKKLVGLTVLYSYGFRDTWSGSELIKINKVDRRDKILNPATPSWLRIEQTFELYETPTQENVEKLISENLHENRYWKNKAEEELKSKDVAAGNDGIRRGARVLSLDRNCSNCGVSEGEMVKKNPRYTLCRGLCVVCYRQLIRKPKLQTNKGEIADD
jgi:hypothetical protein